MASDTTKRSMNEVGFVKTIKMQNSIYADQLDIKDPTPPPEESRRMSHTVLPVSPPPIPKRLVKTALHQAVLDGRLHQVRLLVEKHGVSIDCKDMYGRTPIMLTSMAEEEAGSKMAKILVTAGSDLSTRDNMGRTALAIACMNGREKIVDEILRKDILNINEPDNDGNNPLHHAAVSGNPKIVKLIGELYVKFGLDIDSRNSLGYTALLLACRNGHFVSAYYLLKYCDASPSLRDTETFLNATEWSQRSSRNAPLHLRRLLAPPSAPSFAREHSMYQRPITPVCKHTKLPTWFRSDDIELQRSETFVEGKDARQLVLHEISRAESHGWNAKPKTKTRQACPPSAKLLALSRRRTKSAASPDMTTIFRMYSDQYQPDWRRERGSIHFRSSQAKHIPLVRAAVKAPVIQVHG